MYKAVCIFAGLSLLSARAEIQGNVKSSLNRPLEDVIVLSVKTGHWTLTDEWGHFRINCEDPNDSLTFYRYGYHKTARQVDDSKSLNMVLRPNPVQFDEIPARKISQNPTGSMSLTPHPELSSLASRIPGLSLRTYGGPGGIATLSTDGGPATHTKVLFEGIDLTSSQNGETDLSQIPSFLLGNMSLSKTPALSFGSGAVDGAFQIQSPVSGNKIAYSYGSFEKQSLGIQTWKQIQQWQTELRGGYTDYSGDFIVKKDGKNTRMENNDFIQKFIMASSRRLIGNSGFLSAFILKSLQQRGVPGLIHSPTSSARRNDTLHLSGIRAGWFFRTHRFFFSLSSRKSNESYTNPIYAIDSRHVLEQFHMKSVWKWQPNVDFETESGINLSRNAIHSTDTDTHSRDGIAFMHQSRFSLINPLSFSVGFRTDKDRAHQPVTTWHGQCLWSPTQKTRLVISGGNGFRKPTFNDLFWTPGGNPFLEPERTTFARVEWNQTFSTSQLLSLSYGQKFSKGLIQWLPGDTFWQPINISKSKRNSLSISTKGHSGNLTYEATYSIIRTKDLTENKPLRYAPNSTGFFQVLQHNLWGFWALYISYTGNRIVLYDWPKDITLPAYELTGFTLNRKIPGMPNISFTLDINNLFNQSYMTINGYPEPGRTVQATLTYKPKGKNT